MKKSSIIAASVLMAAALFAGCGSKQVEAPTEQKAAAVEATATPEPTKEPEVTATPEPTEEPKEELKTIGKEEDGCLSIVLENKTGKEIKGLSIRLMDEENFPENMMEKDDKFADKEKRMLFYKLGEAKEIEGKGEKNFALNVGYDIELTFADDTKSILHAFPMGDVKEVEINFDKENELAYIKYESIVSKQTVETIEAEISIKIAEEEAKATKEAEERARAEAEAQAQAEAEAAAQAEWEREQAEAEWEAQQAAAAQAAWEAQQAAQQAQNDYSEGCGGGFAFN